MSYLQLLAAVLSYIPIKSAEKYSSDKISGIKQLMSFGVFRMMVGCLLGLIFSVLGGENSEISSGLIKISLLFGVMLASGMILTILSLNIASVAVSSIFMTASLIIPCLFGVAFLKESITLTQILAIGIFMISVYLIVSKPAKGQKKFTLKAFFICMGVFLTSGIGTVSLQIYPVYVPDGSISLFMTMSYAVGAILMFIAGSVIGYKDNGMEKKFSRNLVIAGTISTCSSFINQQLVTILSSKLSAAVLFPITTGSGVIVGTLVGLIFFREKLTIKNIIGIIAGTAALIVVGI